MVDFESIRNNFGGLVKTTPVLSSQLLNQEFGNEFYFKCENFQKGGSFKLRGAMNAVSKQVQKAKEQGTKLERIGTHSSGNFAQALAIAGSHFGLETHIVMPSNAPQVKQDAVAGYGATIHLCEPTVQDREAKLSELVTSVNLCPFHPYNDQDVIEGQGTATFELLNQQPCDAVYLPIGGGGLVSGAILAAKKWGIPVVGAEPENADDAYRGWKSGIRVEHAVPNTIADGLRTTVGSINFPIIQNGITDIVLVSEKEIIESLKLLYTRLKIVVEPSSAVAFAAAIKSREKGLKLGIVLSGGNVDLAALPF